MIVVACIEDTRRHAEDDDFIVTSGTWEFDSVDEALQWHLPHVQAMVDGPADPEVFRDHDGDVAAYVGPYALYVEAV